MPPLDPKLREDHVTLGMGLCIFLVFDWGVFQFARREREHMERLSDRYRGDLGTDLFAKRIPCSTALAARSDPSVAIRMFLNNLGLLRCLPLSDEKIAENHASDGPLPPPPKNDHQPPVGFSW